MGTAFEQDVGYCKYCHQVWYPYQISKCECKGYYQIVIKLSIGQAIEICELREAGAKYVGIEEGKLVSGNGPVLSDSQNDASDNNEVVLQSGDEELLDPDRKGNGGNGHGES